MNKKLILLAVPHLVVGTVAIWAAWEAHHVQVPDVSVYDVILLRDSIGKLENQVERLERKLGDLDRKATNAGYSGDEAMAKLTRIEKDGILDLDPGFNLQWLRLQKELDRLKDEVSSIKRR